MIEVFDDISSLESHIYSTYINDEILRLNTDNGFFSLTKIGLYFIRIRYNTSKKTYSFSLKTSYSWKNFEIESKFEEELIDNSQWKFNFTLNDQIYKNKSQKDILSLLYQCSWQSGKRNEIHVPLDKYLRSEDIPILTISENIGYTKDGVKSPSNSFFNIKNNDEYSIIKNLRLIENSSFDEKETIKKFKTIYDLTSIDKKDYIFTWYFQSIFAYALRDITPNKFNLEITGPKSSGKSKLGELFTKKTMLGYDNIIPPSSFNTEARVNMKLTSSTFPIFVDESENIIEDLATIVKTSITSNARVQKFKTDHGYLMNKEYITPACYLDNDSPKYFNEPAINQRFLHIFVEKVTTYDPNWLKTFNTIEDGELGVFILNKLKEIDYETLVNLYYSVDLKFWYPHFTRDFKDEREENIMRMMALGAQILIDWFDIYVIIDNLSFLINETRLGSDSELVDFTNQYLRKLCDGKIENYIHNELQISSYNSIHGILITNEMIIDIRNYLKLKRDDLSLVKLGDTLKTKYSENSDHIHFGVHVNYTNNSKRTKSIFISNHYLKEKFKIERETQSIINDMLMIKEMNEKCILR